MQNKTKAMNNKKILTQQKHQTNIKTQTNSMQFARYVTELVFKSTFTCMDDIYSIKFYPGHIGYKKGNG